MRTIKPEFSIEIPLHQWRTLKTEGHTYSDVLEGMTIALMNLTINIDAEGISPLYVSNFLTYSLNSLYE